MLSTVALELYGHGNGDMGLKDHEGPSNTTCSLMFLEVAVLTVVKTIIT